MNKSLATNIIAFVAAVIPLIFTEIPYRNTFLQMGLFALSGSLTNWLAIYMLFERIPLLYGSGIIPARFESFKTGIYNLIMNNFFTEENFQNFMTAKGGHLFDAERILAELDLNALFDGLLNVVQNSKMGNMLGMLGGTAALESLREPFIKEVGARIEAKIKDQDFISHLLGSGDESEYEKMRAKVEGMVNHRLDQLTPQMVKDIIQTMIRKHLGWLVVWGGVFGALMGILSTLINLG